MRSLLRRLVNRLSRLLRRRVPAGAGPRRRPEDGGTTVREPRRPRPTPPAAGATADEPRPDQFLDLDGAGR
ncbi:MAG: hypothetical protein GEU96_21635 [Propionibacteriales bacterium]|nr:hypothetical protein [Propionibacteriales bacterium]